MFFWKFIQQFSMQWWKQELYKHNVKIVTAITGMSKKLNDFNVFVMFVMFIDVKWETEKKTTTKNWLEHVPTILHEFDYYKMNSAFSITRSYSFNMESYCRFCWCLDATLNGMTFNIVSNDVLKNNTTKKTIKKKSLFNLLFLSSIDGRAYYNKLMDCTSHMQSEIIQWKKGSKC